MTSQAKVIDSDIRIDAVRLLQELLRCPSVTPIEAGALDLLEELLTSHGFVCYRLPFSEEGTPDVDNLYARWGTQAPHLCFAGHTDVVPLGDEEAWTFDPFGGEILNGNVCGRGAVDMKGGIAAFAAAAINYIAANKPNGSISFLITGDEEGPSINGTPKMLEWMEEKGEKIDFCIVGEPTSKDKFGDMVKIGRRGSLYGYLTVRGVQGHSAYPHLADNPIPRLVKLLDVLDGLELDDGTPFFQPSDLQIVSVDTGSSGTARNVTPAYAKALFNVRFNSVWSGESLRDKLREKLDASGIEYKLICKITGESFYTEPGVYTDMFISAINKVSGHRPTLCTSGGTSDARYIKDICPVAEFGPLSNLAHQIDELIPVEDMHAMTEIYADVIAQFFDRKD